MAKTCKRVALSVFARNSRQLQLGDNMSTVLCFERCRAKDFKILVQVRRDCAYQLARNMHVAFRWVPSEFNSADAPSRRHESQALDQSLGIAAPPPPASSSHHGAEKGAESTEGEHHEGSKSYPSVRQAFCRKDGEDRIGRSSQYSVAAVDCPAASRQRVGHPTLSVSQPASHRGRPDQDRHGEEGEEQTEVRMGRRDERELKWRSRRSAWEA